MPVLVIGGGSAYTPEAPTAVASTDDCPAVDVTVILSHPDVAFVTLNRRVGINGAPEQVRGAYRTVYAGGYFTTDWEAPVGVDIYYSVIAYDITGTPTPESPLSAPVNLTSTSAWLSDPLVPESCIEVFPSDAGAQHRLFPKLILPTLDALQYAADTSVIATTGSSLPVGRTTQRQAASGLTVSILSEDLDVDDTFRAFFADAFPVLLRLPTRHAIGPLAYLAITGCVERPAAWDGHPVTVWELAASVVRPSRMQLINNPRNWVTASAELATWNDVVATYPGWLAFQAGT